MQERKNIQPFSAADIEKYWKGQLSPEQMHTIEKAAMEDPFLADALEGYQHSLNPSEEINLLNKRLAERTQESSKVMSIFWKKNNILKIAAAVVIITGLGILFNQVFIKKNTTEIAEVNNSQESTTGKTEPTNNSDSTVVLENNTTTESITTNTNPSTNNTASTAKSKRKDPLNQKQVHPSSDVNDSNNNSRDIVGLFKNKDLDSKKEQVNTSGGNREPQAASIEKERKSITPSVLNHLFAGRITDDQNNPVPFANIINTKDQVGTYSDINGKFNLISSDSVMHVEIRSIGFETITKNLFSSKSEMSIVMAEDEKGKETYMVNSKKIVNSRAREENKVTEEPEPEVGWDYYDTYINNNLRIPDRNYRSINGSTVDLKFSIDENGYPIDFKILKSSECNVCDMEVIRLLKEGPKWKKGKKYSETTVTVKVDK